MIRSVLSILCFLCSFTSFSADFIAGKDYEVIQDTSAANAIEKIDHGVSVTEFFSFGCPWCYRIESPLNHWVSQKGDNIFYEKVPVVYNKDWEYYAKAYYTAKALSLNAKMDAEFFKAILKDKRSLNNEKAMTDFFTKNGVDSKTAYSAFHHSPSIDLEVDNGRTLMSRYHINAVPAFVVNNHYKTDLRMAKTQERLFAILDFLTKQAKDEQKA